MRHSSKISRVWVVLVCSVVFAACGINSQPVPPGDTASVGEDGGSGFGGNDAADGSAPPKNADGGVTGTPPDGGGVISDGGLDDAGDAGDASDDGGDAGEDAGDGG